jgi:hypothetical protein
MPSRGGDRPIRTASRRAGVARVDIGVPPAQLRTPTRRYDPDSGLAPDAAGIDAAALPT